MSKLIATLALSSIVSMGCANVIPGNNYTVMLDPAFTSDELASADAAIQDWRNNIPQLTLNVVIQTCAGIHSGEICVHRGISDGASPNALGDTLFVEGKDARGDTGGINGIDGAEIWVDTVFAATMIPQGFPLAIQNTFAHEIGHSLSLRHHDGITALMNCDIQGASPTVTCDDVRQYLWIRMTSILPECLNQTNYTLSP